MKKLLITLGIAVPIIIVLAAATGTEFAQEQTDEAVQAEIILPAVEGVEVTLGKLIGEVRVSGVIEGVSEAYIIPQTGGTIIDVLVNLGDYVSAGEAVAVLEDRGEDLSLQQVEAQLENVKREYNATEKLYARGAASEVDLTRAKSALRGAEVALLRAEDALKARYLTAPIDGYIADMDLSISVGNTITSGIRAARIVDLSSLKLRASLGERQLRLVDIESTAAIVYSTDNEAAAEMAQVSAIAAGSDPSTGAYRVVLEWPNTRSLKRSGMTAEARIATNEVEELIIPAAALITRNGTTGIFTVSDSTAVFTVLSLGRRFGDYVAVSAGLTEGDVVLVSGTTILSDGDEVNVTLVTNLGGAS